MRLQKRNLRTVWHSDFIGKRERIKDGLYTGEWIKEYTEPFARKMSISASRGRADESAFGIDINYTKILATDDLNCPITETSKIWIDVSPDGPANFRVVRIAKSLNFILYAVQEIRDEDKN